jgi:hypothetical protein
VAPYGDVTDDDLAGTMSHKLHGFNSVVPQPQHCQQPLKQRRLA